MELRQIREFLAVLEHGSLGDAARHLKIAQPNLTREIKLLEKDVGGALFVRSSKGMQPTALARAFEPRARVIAGEIDRADRELDAFRGARRGRIVIAAGPVFAQSVLPPALARLRRAHPAVQVTIIDTQARETLDRILAGEIDCAFHSATSWRGQPELATELLVAKEPVIVAARADHPLAQRRRPALEELARANWVLPRAPSFLRKRLDEVFVENGLPPLQPTIEVSTAAFVSEHLLQGDCLSIFARIIARGDLDSGRLKPVAVPQLAWTLDICAITRRDVPLPPAAQVLLAEVRDVCGTLRGN